MSSSDKSKNADAKPAAASGGGGGDKTTGRRSTSSSKPSSRSNSQPNTARSETKEPAKASNGGGSSQRDSNAVETPRSPNKIYRTPPTPVPAKLYQMERSFTLDCIAVNTTSNDFAKANPKLGQVVPPYNSQRDRNIAAYFDFIGVDKTLVRGGQVSTGRTSAHGESSPCRHLSRNIRQCSCR